MKKEWQPAIIANREHVLQFHTEDPGAVTCFAGQKIRVRPITFDEAFALDSCDERELLGCKGTPLEVHPEDGERLWPGFPMNIICTCRVHSD